jgi:hypothetical protein
MSALLLVLTLVAGWSLVGLALLALVGANTSELRVALTAPALGTCVTVLALFPFTEAGVAIETCAVPIALALLAFAVLIVAWRRPKLHPGVMAAAVVCAAGTLLTAWPMLSLGFRWLSNGNDDMANYVLSAQDLLKHGLLAPIDFAGLAHGTDYATTLTSQHIGGSRPGSDILLAFVSQVFGRPPYEMFMPLIVAFNFCGASAVGALSMQIAQRWWVAALAACLLLISPLASYGVLQQLLPQVWALGLTAALFALLMRPELHSGKGARARELIPIAVLAASLVLGYVELTAAMGVAYLVYVGGLALRKQVGLSALLRLWLPVAAVVIVILNSYFFTELAFLRIQSTHGLHIASYPPLFGYIFVPSALPGIVGLQTLPPVYNAPHLNLTIALASIMILAALFGSIAGARRGIAATTVLAVSAALAGLLALKHSDFGLFKLSMYVQPFLAAAVAIWIARIRRRSIRVIALMVLTVLVATALSTQRAYVNASLEATDVPHLSAADVIPAFHSVAARASVPIVSITENPVLIKLEAASADSRRVYFQSRDVFHPFLTEYADEVKSSRHTDTEHALQSVPWVSRSFKLLARDGGSDPFEDNEKASQALASGHCQLVIPGGGELPFNRLSLPSSSPDLVSMSCDAAHDLLAFTSSTLGESFYLPTTRRHVSFFQLQQDPFFPSQTMVGFGRYALFRILGGSLGARLVISLTESLTHNGENGLPPVGVVGSTRVPLPLKGRGSARVFSAPLTPQLIAGVPYLLLDIGADGQLPKTSRTGLQGVYGGSVPLDPRYLTSYVRDVSLVGASQYASLRPPLALNSFPSALDNGNLEYSGIYEDGWIGGDSYVRLASGAKADLVIQGQVPAGAGKRLEILLDGREITSVPVPPGALDVRVPVPASTNTRLVELRFATEIRLTAPDLRPAAAHITFLGFVKHEAK